MDDDRSPESSDGFPTTGFNIAPSEADSIRMSLEAVASLPDLPQTLAGLTAWVQRQFADAGAAAAAADSKDSSHLGAGVDGPPGVAAAVGRLRVLAASRTLALLIANCIKQGVGVPLNCSTAAGGAPGGSGGGGIADDETANGPTSIPDPREDGAVEALAHLLIPPSAARTLPPGQAAAGAAAPVSGLADFVAFTKPAAAVLVRQCGVIAAALGTAHQAALSAAVASAGGAGSGGATAATAHQNAVFEAAAEAAGASLAAAAGAYRSAIGGSLSSLAGATAQETRVRALTGQLLGAHAKLSEALSAAEAKRVAAASSAPGGLSAANPLELAASAATASSVLRAALARRDAAAAALEAALARSSQLVQLAAQGSNESLAPPEAGSAAPGDFDALAAALATALNALPVPGADAAATRMAVVVGGGSATPASSASSAALSLAVPTVVVAPDVLSRLRKEDADARAQAEAVDAAVAAACGPVRSELSHVTTSLSSLEARRAALLKELSSVDDSIRHLSGERSRLQEAVAAATVTLRPRITASETRLAATTSAVTKADAVVAVGGAVAAAMSTAAAAASQIKGAAAASASGGESAGNRVAPAVALPREAVTSTLRCALTYARTEEGLVRALRGRAARSGATAAAMAGEAAKYRSVGMAQFAAEAAQKAETAGTEASQDAASVAHLTGVASRLLAGVEASLLPAMAALRAASSAGASTSVLAPVDLALILAIRAAAARAELAGSEGAAPWGSSLLAAAGSLPFPPALAPADIVSGLCGTMGWTASDAAAAGLSEPDLTPAALPASALADGGSDAVTGSAALAELTRALLSLPVPPLLPEEQVATPAARGADAPAAGAGASSKVHHHHHHHHHHHAPAVAAAAPAVLPLGLPSEAQTLSRAPPLVNTGTSAAAAALMSPARQGHPRRAIRPAAASEAALQGGAPGLVAAASSASSSATPRKLLVAGGKGATPSKLAVGAPGLQLPASRPAPWSPALRKQAPAPHAGASGAAEADKDFPSLPQRSGGGR